jgi:dipeptidyl aminopeptidase/acylaminoacyl peptidase
MGYGALIRALAILALAAGRAAAAAESAAPTDLFTGADIFRLERAGDAQIRPDGRAIAYVRRTFDLYTDRGRSAIWLVDAKSGAQSPLVTGPGSYESPRWSPDGGRLAYVSAAEDGHSQIFVRYLDSGTTARVTDLSDSPGALAWSADGRLLAFLMFTPEESAKLGSAPPKPEGAKWAEPLEVITDVNYRSDEEGYRHHGHRHLYVVTADGGAARPLTSGDYDEQGPLAFTPDGRYVLLAGDRAKDRRFSVGHSQILRVALADGKLEALTTRVGADASPVASPDGKVIAYLGAEDRLRSYENTRLYLMDQDGSHSRSLTDALDRSVDEVRWAADGKSLYISYEDHAGSRFARVGLDGRLQVLAANPTGDALDRPYQGPGAFTVAKNGAIAHAFASPLRPAELALSQDGRTRVLTSLNEEYLSSRTLAEAQPLAVRSSFDQRPIDAWLALPAHGAADKKLPLILEIHGGPFTNYGPVFSTDVQLYAAGGYAVLYSNPRGSTSYGEEFANLIHHDYPSHDYDDLISAVDAAIATGRIDPDQLYVTGGSGGGVLTAWIIGRTQRFKAAAVQKPVINWAAWVLTTDMYSYGTHYWFAKRPWEDPESYWSHSPLSLVGNVTTPTLLVVGDRDFRTPVSDSEQYYQALQLRGIPTGLVKVPGASHGGIAARPSQSAAKASAILAWFDRYRRPAP